MTTCRYELYGEIVDFIDCREVAEGFASILRGWKVREVPHDPTRKAYVTFRREGDTYVWNTPWLAAADKRDVDPSRNVMEAVCDFHYEFIDWYADRNPMHFCIHMAAVEFDGRAVLFPAIQKAGKSTLALHCVERGHRLLGDDVVAVDGQTSEAIALGLLPRMRLPLHPSFEPGFIDFVARHAGLSDKRWQYVSLAEGQILPHGQRLPISGVVILDRRKTGPASIVRAAPSAALKTLIDRNFGMLGDPDRIFDCFHALVRRADCHVLTYSDPAKAAALLGSRFCRASQQRETTEHALA
jgi:hypothetical protein